VIGILLVVGSAAALGAAGDPFEECERIFASGVRGAECCSCFYDVGKQPGLHSEGALRLRRLLEAHPDRTLLRFNLARLEQLQNHPVAEELYRTAADEFLAQGFYLGAVVSLVNLSKFLGQQGRSDEKPAVLDAAAVAAAESGDPYLEGLVTIERANVAVAEGGDLEVVERQLREFYDGIDETTRYVLRRRILFALSDVLYRLGRPQEAQAFDREAIELTGTNDDGFNEAAARFNLAAHVHARTGYGAGTGQVVRLYREALAAAETGGNGFVEVDAHIELGRLIGGAEGREHLETAIESAVELGDDWFRSKAEAALAVLLAADAPEESRRLRAEVAKRRAGAQDDWSISHDWTARTAVNWATLPKEEAVADALTVLDHIEALRSRQHLGQGRADFFSAWTEAFYWLSGRLLEAFRESGDPADLKLAFELAESMRARVLQDALEVSGSLEELPASDPLASERDRLLDEVVGVNRNLLAESSDGPERRRLLGELESLERELADIEDRIAEQRGSPGPRRLFSSAADVRQALDESTAFLTFQIAPWKNIYGDHAGGSWLTVTTVNGTRVYPLPGRRELESKLETFLGLFDRSRPGEEVAAASLYGDLLSDGLAELPESVRKLVIVPDGMLYLVPFAVLRAAEAEPMLAERFVLSEAPSATLWLEWQGAAEPEEGAAALVLADPLVAGQTQTAVAERGWDRGSLGPLPHAREEGRAIIRRMGGESRLLVGAEASEALLKRTDLSRYRLLHFAAHGVTDGRYPSRSALILSPGSPSEDGLLQPREIAELDLAERIVVLAACESAGGQVLSGEGALSLARPFLQGRAATVVATLWRIDDAAAAALFKRFYRHLARGRTVAGALRAAQKDRILAGAPASDWAGVVALGNGDLVVAGAGGRRWFSPPAVVLALSGLFVAGLLLFLSIRSLLRAKGKAGRAGSVDDRDEGG
jgi:CHAT domain-containing protein